LPGCARGQDPYADAETQVCDPLWGDVLEDTGYGDESNVMHWACCGDRWSAGQAFVLAMTLRLGMASRVVALVCAWLAPVSSVHAQPARPRVERMLHGFETAPAAERLRALGPEVVGALIAIREDARAPRLVRMRALGALGAFAEPRVRAYLLSVARSAREPDLVVRQALLSLYAAFGPRACGKLSHAACTQPEHPPQPGPSAHGCAWNPTHASAAFWRGGSTLPE
jgi:hypothetical protein